MNKLAKKIKRRVWAKQRANIKYFKKKKKKENQIWDKPKQREEAKLEVKLT